jgi:hypothetical protein
MKCAQDKTALYFSADADALAQQIERILRSGQFRASGQPSGFLRFIVEETLARCSSKFRAPGHSKRGAGSLIEN